MMSQLVIKAEMHEIEGGSALDTCPLANLPLTKKHIKETINARRDSILNRHHQSLRFVVVATTLTEPGFGACPLLVSLMREREREKKITLQSICGTTVNTSTYGYVPAR